MHVARIMFFDPAGEVVELGEIADGCDACRVESGVGSKTLDELGNGGHGGHNVNDSGETSVHTKDTMEGTKARPQRTRRYTEDSGLPPIALCLPGDQHRIEALSEIAESGLGLLGGSGVGGVDYIQ